MNQQLKIENSKLRTARKSRRSFWKALNYKMHLWFGLWTALFVVVISVTGILLNHKREWGLMVEPEHKPSATIERSLPLSRLVRLATQAFNHPDYRDESGINRMDYRPARGYIKVRFRDAASTEVVLDTVTGRVLSVAPRRDVFLEQLHSGELFGENWVLLSDITGVALLLLTGSGIYIWLYPRLKRRARRKRVTNDEKPS